MKGLRKQEFALDWTSGRWVHFAKRKTKQRGERPGGGLTLGDGEHNYGSKVYLVYLGLFVWGGWFVELVVVKES